MSLKSVYLKPKIVKVPRFLFWHLVTTVIPVTFHHIHASCETLTLCVSFVIMCIADSLFVLSCGMPLAKIMCDSHISWKCWKKIHLALARADFKRPFQVPSLHVFCYYLTAIYFFGNHETGHLTILPILTLVDYVASVTFPAISSSWNVWPCM